jgi:hypothetical protein
MDGFLVIAIKNEGAPSAIAERASPHYTIELPEKSELFAMT